VPVQSADFTAVVLHLPNQSVLVVLVYIKEKNIEVLQDITNKLY